MLSTLQPPRFKPIAREQYATIAEKVCPMRYETSAAPVMAQRKLVAGRIGSVSIVHYESCGLEHGRRTLDHIRAEPDDYFLLSVPLAAKFHFDHAGLETDVGNGFAVLLDSRRPFDAYINGISSDGRHASLQVRVPGAMLRSRLPMVDQLCNRPFPLGSAVGALMLSTLQTSLAQAHALTDLQAARHSAVLAEVIANAMWPLCDSRLELAPAGKRNTQPHFDRAMAYIESRLSAPELDAAQIAAHCRISLRYLHKIFAQRGLMVAATVREARLTHCREALRHPQLASRPVHEIAGRWGFNDPTHFSRLYKKHFGIPPSRDRSTAAGNGDG